jgi:hypothetical protein
MFIEIGDYVKKFKIDRSKIDLYVNHYHVEYDPETGAESKNITRFEITECTSEDFSRNDYERKYWNSTAETIKYCID